MKGNYLIIKLFILLMLAPQSGFTQYKSFFGKEMTSWNRVLHSHDKMGVDSINVLSSDTVRFNNNLYYRVSHGNVNIPPFPGPRNYLRYVVREDTTKGRLYHYDTSTKTEFLVVDMSLNKGDTFYTNMLIDTFIVDSVYYISGTKHLHLSIVSSNSYIAAVWAEGVGGLHMIIFMPGNRWGGGFDSEYLACQFKDGSHVYTNFYSSPIDPHCNIYYSNGITEKTAEESILSAYPNPATDYFIINGIGSNEAIELKMYDVMSKVVLNKRLNSQKIDITHLTNGLYNLVILRDNGLSCNIKLVINK